MNQFEEKTYSLDYVLYVNLSFPCINGDADIIVSETICFNQPQLFIFKPTVCWLLIYTELF